MTAQDGPEAIAVYEHHKDQIDVILSDIELPEMDGRMMHSRLQQINPQVKVIFTSDYHDPETQARCEREGIQALIPKPFKLDESREHCPVSRGSKTRTLRRLIPYIRQHPARCFHR